MNKFHTFLFTLQSTNSLSPWSNWWFYIFCYSKNKIFAKNLPSPKIAHIYLQTPRDSSTFTITNTLVYIVAAYLHQQSMWLYIKTRIGTNNKLFEFEAGDLLFVYFVQCITARNSYLIMRRKCGLVSSY